MNYPLLLALILFIAYDLLEKNELLYKPKRLFLAIVDGLFLISLFVLFIFDKFSMSIFVFLIDLSSLVLNKGICCIKKNGNKLKEIGVYTFYLLAIVAMCFYI